MTSKEALYLLMTNQKNVRDDFRFIDLNTGEKVSIEECYDIVIKDLEVLEILKKYAVRIFDYPEGGDYFCLELHRFISEKEGAKFKEWLEK